MLKKAAVVPLPLIRYASRRIRCWETSKPRSPNLLASSMSIPTQLMTHGIVSKLPLPAAAGAGRGNGTALNAICTSAFWVLALRKVRSLHILSKMTRQGKAFVRDAHMTLPRSAKTGRKSASLACCRVRIMACSLRAPPPPPIHWEELVARLCKVRSLYHRPAYVGLHNVFGCLGRCSRLKTPEGCGFDVFHHLQKWATTTSEDAFLCVCRIRATNAASCDI